MGVGMRVGVGVGVREGVGVHARSEPGVQQNQLYDVVSSWKLCVGALIFVKGFLSL